MGFLFQHKGQKKKNLQVARSLLKSCHFTQPRAKTCITDWQQTTPSSETGRSWRCPPPLTGTVRSAPTWVQEGHQRPEAISHIAFHKAGSHIQQHLTAPIQEARSLTSGLVQAHSQVHDTPGPPRSARLGAQAWHNPKCSNWHVLKAPG